MTPFIDDARASERAPDTDVNIIDIRSDQARIELKSDITKGLNVEAGTQKSLPTLLLYDERGLKLYEQITYLDEYYLFNEEVNVLQNHAADIAKQVPDNAMVIELGSGNLRKIKLLLDALNSARKHVDYFALDLDRAELERTLRQVGPESWQFVTCSGLHGTYDDGLQWLNLPENQSRRKIVLSMGSSIGNFDRAAGAAFVDGFVSALGSNDSMIIAIDACQDKDRVHKAYNDSKGVTTQFTLNGLHSANKLLGSDVFNVSDWKHIGEYDDKTGRHEAFLAPKCDLQILGVQICKHERIKIEESYKYSLAQREDLWRQANVRETARWSNDDQSYGLHMIGRALPTPTAMFATTPEQYAAHPVPAIGEWQALWQVWDTVTQQMIPNEELNSKPIKLRNACIFYLGHIPTFLDMKIVEATGKEATEPKYFHSIFERGIDPDVDNPEHCHAHSAIPDEWPELSVILDYQKRIRARVTEMYKSRLAYEDAWAGRVLWLGLEHEAMHLETLLYMLIQSDKTLPPQGVSTPEFEMLAAQAVLARKASEWIDVPAQTLTLGLNDPDTRDGPLRHFGWDVEKPQRKVSVAAFQASTQPITNLDYARYLSETGTHGIPAAWQKAKNPLEGRTSTGDACLDGFIAQQRVKTVFGAVPLLFALDWPVSASYDELAKCAAYMGGRIPTLEEARSIYKYAEMTKQRECLQSLQQTIPAVNGHLINEGVQESPPAGQSIKPASGDAVPSPRATFADLTTANVGFRHWTPVSVTSSSKLAGQAEMGGLWEWTSSPLEKQEGFKAMDLYPAYSEDFYDGKHNVVLGGSWATHPRLAGRKSFVNWYQRNYPYVWAGARLVRDI